MIARIWHGATETEKADEYVEYLNHTRQGAIFVLTDSNPAAVTERNCGEMAAQFK